MRYQHFQNSASLVIENVDITLGKPREISKLSQTRQASWAKVLISHEKACDKCIIWNPRVTNGVSSGLSRDNIANNTPSSLDDTAMTSSEKDVMKEFEDTVNDIMIQGRLYHLPENISLCFKSSLGRPACGSTICNLFF